MALSQSTKLVILIGAASTAAGVVAGLLPIESGPMALSDCGSVFAPGNPYLEGPECGGARSARSLFVWGPIVLGIILMAGALVIDPGRKKPAADSQGE